MYSLFDSGADMSCIHPAYLDRLEVPVSLGEERLMTTAKDSEHLVIKERVTLDFYIDDVLMSDEFLVVPSLTEEVVIGAATLQKWRIKLDFEHDVVLVSQHSGRYRI